MEILLADYQNVAHCKALVQLLDAYARDPAGGGTPLPDDVKARLPAALAARPQAFSVLAFEGAQPVGLVNCIEGFSTFAAAPLVNIHDAVVLPSHRGRRVLHAMFEVVERESLRRDACKLTLEVLTGNAAALLAYAREGFLGYQLDATFGHAIFLQKKLV